MKTKLSMLFGLLVIASLVLAACGGGATTPEAPAEEPAATEAPAEEPAATEAPAEEPAATEAPGEITEVTFWHAYGTGSAEEQALAKVLEQAAVDLPQYQINVLQVPFNDIFNKYATDVASGAGPDMYIAPNDNLGDQARNGLIADISALAEGRLGDYTPLAVEGMSVDGQLYGIPESLKAVVFW